MNIKNIFAKPIDRDIKGVIKVGQTDEENIKQELEEYVVTRELAVHFADFFASYKKGINGNTDKMGVWISGFFGSGKSHFLKILSYLLANKEAGGKKALDFFLEDQKIKDAVVLADMKLAVSKAEHADIILFNIDSKSELAGKQSKDAIVSVFLKTFNEMQGFYGSSPYLADFESSLTERCLYDEFKTKFKAEYGKEWEDARHRFDFIQDTVVGVLVGMGFMTEAAARNWCEKTTEHYNISIETFAKMVKDYIDQKGGNHHVVFLVDEMGQYIGADSSLMLNLQTVTEDLGTACRGKAWIIVTSQQDIDSTVKDMDTRNNDFSKIQGRFDTRLSLSSANVDKVIRKRVLEKNQTADQTLRLLYEQRDTIIKNLIFFNDGIEKKLYSSDYDFSAVYPFVPYQFNLLASVLTSIRTHGASGKHLSEGERSMLALFKESAMKLMNEEVGVIVQFSLFYDALHQFLDHSHKSVITRAAENSYINPDKEEDCFAVNVLKTLFLIKYVKEIIANADNLTSLMINSVGADRIALKKRVEEALKILIDQTLVQKNGDVYVFLTDEEQEINREINSQSVETGEITGKISELIFDDLYSEKKYRYHAFRGRYTFDFNQMVDDRYHRTNQNHEITVRILTPGSDYGDETSLRIMSEQGKEVLVVLPNDLAFMDELKSSLKIGKYLRFDSSARSISKYNEIRRAKEQEMSARSANARMFLNEALMNADVYVNGDKSEIASKDVKVRINAALDDLVSTVYNKLSYIDAPMDETNIRSLIKESNQQTFALEDEQEINAYALRDLLEFISSKSSLHSKTSMKTIMDRFMKAPYGFVEDDVEWLVAKLFKKGDIALSVSGENVTLINKSEDEIIRYITKREYVEKLLIERREKATENQKKVVREVMKELFHTSSVGDDDDAMMDAFIKYSTKILGEIEKLEIIYKATPRLPGQSVIGEGKKLLRSVNQRTLHSEFFAKLQSDRDLFLNFADDYGRVNAFFNGEQRAIFEKALEKIRIYDDSKNFIIDEQIQTTVCMIKDILSKDIPYTDIPKLPELIQRFEDIYMKVLADLRAPVYAAIEDAMARVLGELETKAFIDEFKARFFNLFEEIKHKTEHCNNVANLYIIRAEADALKVRLLNEIAEREKKFTDTKGGDASPTTPPKEGPASPPQPNVKKRRSISIKSVNVANSWQIETEQHLDKYLSDLRGRIIEEIDEDTIINIEF